MKKLLSILLAGVCMMTSLAGCGNQKTETEDKTVVRLWTNVNQDSPQSMKDYQAWVESKIAEKFPEYEVIFEQKVMTDYNQEYDKALMAGNAPDAFDWFSYTSIPSRIKNGTIADISSLIEEWDMKKNDMVINTFDDVINADGKWYAVPRDAYVQGLYVNKASIKAGGEDPENLPVTWDEFNDYCLAITDKSVPRFGYAIMGMEYCAWPFTAWVWSAGGEMVEKAEDGKWRIAFADEAGVDAAAYLNKLVNESKVTQTDVLCSLGDTYNDMLSGKNCFAWGTLASVNAEQIKQFDLTMDDFTQIAIPVKDKSIKNPVLAGGEVITINPTSAPETQKAAFEVMTYMYYDEEFLTEKWQREYDGGSATINVPARKDLYEKKMQMNPLLSDDQKQKITDMAQNAIPEPYCEHWSDLKNALVVPLQKIYLTAGLSRQDIQKLLSDCADELVSLYPETFIR